MRAVEVSVDVGSSLGELVVHDAAMPPELLAELGRRRWLGDVRELRNDRVERATVLGPRAELDAFAFASAADSPAVPSPPPPPPPAPAAPGLPPIASRVATARFAIAGTIGASPADDGRSRHAS